MKNKTPIALFLFVLLSLALFAADAVAPTTGNAAADNIVRLLTPILVPLILAGVKYVAPKLPSWTIPLAAPILGILIDVLQSLATGHSTNLVVAATLGLAGVGIREIKENLVSSKNGGWPVPTT